MSEDNTPVILDLEMRYATERAFGFRLNIRDPLVWCPKRFVEDNGDGTFTMPTWLMIEKGLGRYVVS